MTIHRGAGDSSKQEEYLPDLNDKPCGEEAAESSSGGSSGASRQTQKKNERMEHITNNEPYQVINQQTDHLQVH
uniref:Uncharacterized protein n=1 Tax=Oryza glumipatula TaxID=40148 RepID=A0A0E0B814_9ORYZ